MLHFYNHSAHFNLNILTTLHNQIHVYTLHKSQIVLLLNEHKGPLFSCFFLCAQDYLAHFRTSLTH